MSATDPDGNTWLVQEVTTPNAVPFPGVPNAQASGEDMTGGTPHSLLHA